MDIDFLSLSEAINSFNPLVALVLGCLYFVVELLDSGLTFTLYFVLAIEIAAIVSNYLYIVPIAIGAALGSYATVEYEKKKRPLKNDKA